jgi:hypothetical protein
MKDNFEEKPLTELCFDRYASWNVKMKLRSSTTGAALYLVEGHEFPNVRNLRRTSAQQTARITRMEEMRTELMGNQQIIAANPADGEEAHMARMVILYNETEMENLRWKGDAIEYGNQRNTQHQVSEAEKYIAKGDVALGAMLSQIRSTIDNNLEVLVDEAMIGNMEDKAAQINSALASIKEVMRGDATAVKEKLRAKLGDIKNVTKISQIPRLMDKISAINIKHKQSMDMFGGQSTIRPADLKRQLTKCLKGSGDEDVKYINICIKTMEEDTEWDRVKKMVKDELVKAAIDSHHEVGGASDGSEGSGNKGEFVALAAKVTGLEKQMASQRGGRGGGAMGRGQGGRGDGERGRGAASQGTGGRGYDGGRGRGDQRGGRGDSSGDRGAGRSGAGRPFAGTGKGECWEWTDKGSCRFGDVCKFSHKFGDPAAERGNQGSGGAKLGVKRDNTDTIAYGADQDSDASGASGKERGGSPYPHKK